MEKIVAIFLLGVAAGVFGYRFYILYTVNKIPFTHCDYCQFWIERERLFPSKISKRKSKKE